MKKENSIRKTEIKNPNDYACEFATWLYLNLWIPSIKYPQLSKVIDCRNTKTEEVKSIKELETQFFSVYTKN